MQLIQSPKNGSLRRGGLVLRPGNSRLQNKTGSVGHRSQHTDEAGGRVAYAPV